jgi:hypothetical protein
MEDPKRKTADLDPVKVLQSLKVEDLEERIAKCRSEIASLAMLRRACTGLQGEGPAGPGAKKRTRRRDGRERLIRYLRKHGPTAPSVLGRALGLGKNIYGPLGARKDLFRKRADGLWELKP